MGILDRLFDRKRNAAVKGGAPDFSNVEAGSSTAGTPSPVSPPAGPRMYTVVKGDSLSKIAEREYGNANRCREIYEANRATIKNPNLIYPGQKLRIP